jgi:formylglycine-generating enzyme required for sulfatase activity
MNFNRYRLALTLLLLLIVTGMAMAAPRRALLLVWDSADRQVVVKHRAMVNHLKVLRAEGHFRTSGLATKIKVYDFAVPEHAASLKLLGLNRAEDCPYLSMIALDAQGLPAKVLWGVRYAAPEQATTKLDVALGIQSRDDTVGLVLGSDPANPELTALTDRLRARILAGTPELERSRHLTHKLVELHFDRKAEFQLLHHMKVEPAQAPWLGLVRFEHGRPLEPMWFQAVKNVDLSWNALIAYGEDTKSRAALRAVVLVGDPAQNETQYYSLQGKLNRLLESNQFPGVDRTLILLAEGKASGHKHSAPAVSLVELDADHKPTQLVWASEVVAGEDATLLELARQAGAAYAPPQEFIYPKDGSVMRRIEGGQFMVGGTNLPADGPPHESHVASFYLSKLEVTNEQFSRFEAATNYRTEAEIDGGYLFRNGKFIKTMGCDWRAPEGPGSSAGPQLPVVQVTFGDAEAYAKWAGLRLPNEVEWERAARGSDNRAFPWGDTFATSNLRSSVGLGHGGAGKPVDVGSFPAGASPFGILDMAGNAYEWVDSLFAPYPGNQTGNNRYDGSTRIVRGGCWGNEDASDFYTYHRTAMGVHDRQGAVGFRVAL